AWGNHYSYIQRSNSNQVLGLYPLFPGDVTAKRDTNTSPIVYKVKLRNGGYDMVAAENMVHVRGYSIDGVTGMSPVAQLQEALGLDIAARTFGARFFAKDARPAVFFEYPGTLGDEGERKLKESIERSQGGLDNKWSVMVGEEGLKIHTITMPMDDAQFLETRGF